MGQRWPNIAPFEGLAFMTILITGVAGFIGNHLAHRLAAEGHEIVGIDNLSDYYDVGLKQARLKRLEEFANCKVEIFDLNDAARLTEAFATHKPETVVHLAAQPGVLYALDDPSSYVNSNLVGFANVLEACRSHPPRHMVFASSSSVYGANQALPSAENNLSAHPLSFYAATKKANEAMAHSYAHLFGVPMTGLRFFTVYGEWGRPDMAFFKFTRAILKGEPIDVYNHGKMSRDFTYIDDIIESVVRVLDKPPLMSSDWDPRAPETAVSGVAPYRLYNIGNGAPVELMDCIGYLEKSLGRKAEINFKPTQPGEVEATWSDTSALETLTGFAPSTPVETGISNFVAWYKDYFGAN